MYLLLGDPRLYMGDRFMLVRLSLKNLLFHHARQKIIFERKNPKFLDASNFVFKTEKNLFSKLYCEGQEEQKLADQNSYEIRQKRC